MPRARLERSFASTALPIGRILKQPMGCRHSSLRVMVLFSGAASSGMSGVIRDKPARRMRASSMAAASTGLTVMGTSDSPDAEPEPELELADYMILHIIAPESAMGYFAWQSLISRLYAGNSRCWPARPI